MKKIIIGMFVVYSLHGDNISEKVDLEVSKIINNLENNAISQSNASYYDVRGKGSCVYWYYFVKGAYSELNNHSIHVENGIFYKLQETTLKLHSKALSVCKGDKTNYYSYLDGSSYCGNCIPRALIENAHIRIFNIEKRKKHKRIQSNKRSNDADEFLQTIK